MRSLFLTSKLIFVFAVSIFLTGCTTPATNEPVDVSGEISALNVKFMEAYNSGDPAGVAAQYASDANLYPPNSDAIEGKEAIEAFWQGPMDGGIAKVELETVSATAYGDIAYEVGKVKLYTADDQMVDRAKYMVIWKKIDGEWKMYEDIWNTSMPAPAPPEETPAEETPAEETSPDDTEESTE